MIEWWLERFSHDEHKFVFRETADEHPDAETGDVTLVLQEHEHSVFNRNELFRGTLRFGARKHSFGRLEVASDDIAWRNRSANDAKG